VLPLALFFHISNGEAGDKDEMREWCVALCCSTFQCRPGIKLDTQITFLCLLARVHCETLCEVPALQRLYGT